MLTRTGWGVLAGAGGMVLAGRVLGAFELYLLGAGAAALVAVSLLAVNLARLQVGLSRTLIPPRVHAGGPARVELRVVNHARRRTPTLRLHDAVTGTKGANLLLSPLGSHEQARAAYQLPTDKRGALTVGPLELVVADPFGLCESRTTGLGTSQLVVYPHIDELLALEHASSHDPQATSRHPNALGRVGDDFYALRPYVVGDDLRRVHWPSVARTGELMMRQHELPWQERTTVLLDVRSGAHRGDTFERAVSAAASVLVAAHGRGDQIRLVCTNRSDSGFGLGPSHLDALLHHLALLKTDGRAALQTGLDDLVRKGVGGSLVIVVGALNSADVPRFNGITRRFGTVATVVFEPGADPTISAAATATAAAATDQQGGVAISGLPHLLRCNPGDHFATLWNRSSLVGVGRGRSAPAAATSGGAPR
ncbi:MAG: DUF58 domain-containing protein [Acidimicrobiia bacterium]